MNLQQLLIKNFRNVESLDLNLKKGIHLFFGQNGQGKTNIVESVYVLAHTHSFRTYHNKELIQYDQDESEVSCRFKKQGIIKTNKIVLSKEGKICYLNRVKVSKLSEYLGELQAVSFTPSDVTLLKDSPKERRHLLDVELSTLFPVYLKQLIRFQKLLEQRNALFKQRQGLNQTLLSVIDEQLLDCQFELYKRRKWLIEQLQKLSIALYQTLSDQNETLKITYKTFVEENDKQTYLKVGQSIYSKNLVKDQEKMFTQVGVHKDDFVVYLNGKDASLYASQGQQRAIMLAIKLSLLEIIATINKEDPILILDDVFSELDEKKCLKLLEYISQKEQVLITCTEVPKEINQLKGTDIYLYQVSQGKLIERSVLSDG